MPPFLAENSTGVFVIDVDGLTGAEVQETKTLLASHPNCAFVFLSPSENGLKAGFLVPFFRNDYEFKQIFFYLETHLKDTHGVTIDPSCKDITRLCFISADKGIVINEDAEIIPLLPPLS
ncbi:hypothetical protein BMR07_18145 [Methylococcaceae bacterium CS1]|nr:hypothetical protein BMR10_17540 [Methylococcaceae bacterium CS4]TXK93453.1 hypothetical protein BMR11_16905 [Methylococcaceae bacterium CS5]TXL02265.1 hypothetical protein BMR07_18145 [Methylococcaceae bacterium CS1]TXL02610.1 hypothetical protein BMR08_18065 [Methylococcaceae bacterium CS2]